MSRLEQSTLERYLPEPPGARRSWPGLGAPRVFWSGLVLVVLGVLAHLVTFVGPLLRGEKLDAMGMNPSADPSMPATDPMPMAASMAAGMALIVVGLAVTGWGSLPRTPRGAPENQAAPSVRALAGRKLGVQDGLWVVILMLALVVDTMKPATIGFVLPGMKTEYGLATGQLTYLPMAGIGGTVLGSLLWGFLADRVGRRGAMLLATTMFIGTSVCGTMPTYRWNLLMCLLMGLSAGGLVPVVFSLLAEIAPDRHRGWLGVFVSGFGLAGGYLAASAAAALLEPVFGWRVLWLVGLPTGVLLLVLAYTIPESPRFLLMTGRVQDAARMMRRLRVELVPAPAGAAAAAAGRPAFASAPRRSRRIWVAVATFGFTCGLVQFGFMTWLPELMHEGLAAAGGTNTLLSRAALVALPFTLVWAMLYRRIGPEVCLAVGAVGSAVAMLGLVVFGRTASHAAVLVLVVALIAALNAAVAVLTVYSAEIFPTKVRARGSGSIAGAVKVGGFVGPIVIAVALTMSGSPVVGVTLLAVLLIGGGLLVVWAVDRRPALRTTAVAGVGKLR
ncbi:MAG: MFS transporter [Mycobacteriales bacterium]